MYCQIKVKVCHRNFLRFFWRFNGSNSIETLRLTSLPFGLNCSPFIAISCLKELARSQITLYPKSSYIILNDSYIDDFVSGTDSLDEAISICKNLQEICFSAKFNLRKWSSNNEELLKTLETASNNKTNSFEIQRESTKVLGILWCPKTDNFTFDFKMNSTTKITKRSVLSQFVSFFDPFGWFGPIIVIGKIFIQELWLNKFDWDEEIPNPMQRFWQNFINDIPVLNQLKIERHFGDVSSGSLCVFTDASEKAYGACIYFVNDNTVKLIASKSRIAPLKKITLARLELCAALLGAKLLRVVTESFKIYKIPSFLWTDSTIVLAWLSKPANIWKTFVGNRVSEIHTIIPDSKWQHVKSSENPADILSRGVAPSSLLITFYGGRDLHGYEISKKRQLI